MIIRTPEFTIPLPPLSMQSKKRAIGHPGKRTRLVSKPTYGELIDPQDGVYVVSVLRWID